MKNWIKKYPLWTCLIVAFLLRLPAVVYSRGYMASDDHYETVQIAYDAVRYGLLNDSGLMKWNAVASADIARSPLYVLFLYSSMYIQKIVGIINLDPMMYLIRFIHALLSLLTVWFGYRYVEKTTAKKGYAVLTALILGGHFLLPYLSVRNLIEQVSADILVPALFFAYMGTKEKSGRLLLLSGILSGLAWMIRFNTALAAIPIPFVIWYLTKNVRPALYFCAGAAFMVIFSGSLDYVYLGSFARSSINILNSIFYPSGAPPLPNSFWTYTLLTLGVFIPPFSFYFILSFFRGKNIRKHLILFSSAAVFFLVHSFITHKEERFLIPIFPLLIIMGVIGLEAWVSGGNIIRWNRRIFNCSAILAIAVNVILLPIFTFNYGHKGLVEPYVYLSYQRELKNMLVDRTEGNKLTPYQYAGAAAPPPIRIDDWGGLSPRNLYFPKFYSTNYFIVFSDTALEVHLDSLTRFFGPLRPVFHSQPSAVDRLLHFMNPRHNFANESWVFKRDIE